MCQIISDILNKVSEGINTINGPLFIENNPAKHLPANKNNFINNFINNVINNFNYSQ